MFTREDDIHVAPTVEERRLAELLAVREPIAARHRRSFILWFVSIGLALISSGGMSESGMSNVSDYVAVGSFFLWLVSLGMWGSVRSKLIAINGEIANVRGTLGLAAGQTLPTTTAGSWATDQPSPTDGFYGLDLGHLTTVVDAHDADTLILNFKYRPALIGSPAFHGLLDHLGFNASATIARLGNTRPIDGTQTAEGTVARAYWTYHPDQGLKIIFERK